MWYIWKARNDNRFQRKTWTPMQVHNAVAAHIQPVWQAINDRRLFTAGWFSVREK